MHVSDSVCVKRCIRAGGRADGGHTVVLSCVIFVYRDMKVIASACVKMGPTNYMTDDRCVAK